MRHQLASVLASVSLFQSVNAVVAPDVTWVQDGYNFIAKLPCVACPFLYQDNLKGEKTAWMVKKDGNALLLNVSLPYDSVYISVNTANIKPGSSDLPIIYANQVEADIASSDLDTLIRLNQLEASKEIQSGGGSFGLSYRQSLRRLPKSSALVFQFDVFELWTDLTEKETRFKLDHEQQKMLEVVLLQRPVYSALEPVSFEIVKADLVSRPNPQIATASHQQVMRFKEWDSFGKKGTASHALSSWGSSLIDYLDSGFWALFIFLMGIIAFFVLICILCIFGCDFCQDEYEQAQHGKAKGEKRRGRSDVEQARVTFRSAEELGLMSRGRIIGIGKSD